MESLSAEEWYKKHKDSILAQINSPRQISKPPEPSEYRDKKTDLIGGEAVGNASVTPIRDDIVSMPRRASVSPIDFRVLIYALIVLGASSLLVNASLEVFGYGWQGWVKAILLEVGIISLVGSSHRLRWRYSWEGLQELFRYLLTKATLVLLIYLSFSVLHTGVEDKRSQSLTALSTKSSVLTALEGERSDWQAIHDNYAENRITDKRNAMQEVSRLNEEIRRQKLLLTDSQASELVSLKSDTDMLMRAALLLLNIIFGHKVFQYLFRGHLSRVREEQTS